MLAWAEQQDWTFSNYYKHTFSYTAVDREGSSGWVVIGVDHDDIHEYYAERHPRDWAFVSKGKVRTLCITNHRTGEDWLIHPDRS